MPDLSDGLIRIPVDRYERLLAIEQAARRVDKHTSPRAKPGYYLLNDEFDKAIAALRKALDG